MILVCLLLLTSLQLAQNSDSKASTPTPASSNTPSQSSKPPSSPSDKPSDVLAAARALIQRGAFEQGISQLKSLQASNPHLQGLSREFGTAYFKHGDYTQAVNYLKQASQEDPNDKEAVQLLGLSYYFSGRPAEAIPLLERVNSWYPSANVDASYVLGICYIRQRQYDQARKAFATMYGVPPDSAPAYMFAARMLLRQEFDPIAESFAQKSVALDPKLPMAHLLLGELYLYKSRIPEAIAEFQKELALNPGHAPTYYKLADAYSRAMKFDDAEKLLQRSIWLDATASGPYILMGKVLLKKGEPELALRSLRHALKMDPNNYMGHHLLGDAFRALGQTADADRELQLAQQLQAIDTNQP
jgi:tetratricopeptide (TPR) repeat protein